MVLEGLRSVGVGWPLLAHAEGCLRCHGVELRDALGCAYYPEPVMAMLLRNPLFPRTIYYSCYATSQLAPSRRSRVSSAPRFDNLVLRCQRTSLRPYRVNAPVLARSRLRQHSARAGQQAVLTMAGQQQQIIDTIFNMKRKMLRRDDCTSTFASSLELR